MLITSKERTYCATQKRPVNENVDVVVSEREDDAETVDLVVLEQGLRGSLV